MSTIFGKIIAKTIPADIVYEDSLLIVIKDISPQAPVHLLIITKKPYTSVQDIPQDELLIVSAIVQVAQKLAKDFHISDSYRLLTNHGALAGQTIFHLHFHLIGGKELGPIA